MPGVGTAHGARRVARLALATGVVLAMAWHVAAVAAATSGPPTLTLSASTCLPGDTLTVKATGLGGPGGYPILLAAPGVSVTLGQATANAAGSFTTKVTIPAATADGDYQVSTFDTAEELVTAPLHVGPPDTPGPATTPPDEATDTSGDIATDEGADLPTDTPAPSDPYPVPEGARDIAFVLLVVGSLAVAAWGFGSGRVR
ncbi:MAG: hypothetical protein ACHQZR_00990 [Candidatus Limnocylindrales bacterium]